MKRVFILACILLTTATATAQFRNQRQNRFNQPSQSAPTENEKANMKKKQAERQKEFIENFISTLEADDFQREIAKQTLNDYFKKSKEFMKISFDNSTKRKEAFLEFRMQHFAELKALLTANDNKKLDDFFEGKFEESEVKKKRRKNRKRKKNKEDDN